MSGKEENATRSADQEPLPGGNFQLFVQKLGYQALISMGILENPVTGSKSTNLPQAQSVIDDLVMLRDKTRGNLEEKEDEHLSSVIRDLQSHFVALSKTAGAGE